MIGVFDSGHGGLTVLRALMKKLPSQKFIYLGDHGYAPYGSRTSEEVYHLTIARVQVLFEMGCPLVILACNTAAATALRRLQQDWLLHHFPNNRVLGVLVPMVEAITGVPWMADVPASRHAGERRTIAVFATHRTVISNAYPVEIGKRAPEVRVVQQACPHLVDLIEEGASETRLRQAVHRYVEAMMQKLEGKLPQAVMLGCTHYPLVADFFAEALPVGMEILSQPDLTAQSLAAYLDRHPEFSDDSLSAEDQPARFYTTGDAARVSELATAFFGQDVPFRPLAIPHQD